MRREGSAAKRTEGMKEIRSVSTSVGLISLNEPGRSWFMILARVFVDVVYIY